MPAGPTFLKKGLGPDLEDWLAVATRGGGSLTGRKAGLWRGRLPDRKEGLPAGWDRGELPLLQQVPRASCSNPSGSDQQDGTAQAEGSLQEGTPLQTEGGSMGWRGDRKSCLGC